MQMEVLLLDEVSMLDVEIWGAMVKLLGIADHTRRGFQEGSDAYLVVLCDPNIVRPSHEACAIRNLIHGVQ